MKNTHNTDDQNHNNHTTNLITLKPTREDSINFTKSIFNLIPLDSLNIKIVTFNVLIGQLLALIGVGNGFIAKLIQNKFETNISMSLTCFYYFLLFLTSSIIFRKFKKPKFYYFLIAIFDSQGNFFNVKAFSQTQFNFPFIVNISSVLWTLLITWIFIQSYKYRYTHVLGVFIVISGITASIYGKIIELYNSELVVENLNGIILCCISALCYSISAVLQEVKFRSGGDIYEFLPWLGLIGLAISGPQAYFLGEFDSLDFNLILNTNTILLIFGFGFTLVIFITISPFFIRRCSASMFNISLVSQIFWSYLIDTLFFSSKTSYEYYIGFALIISGVFIFHRKPVIELNKNKNEYDDEKGENRGSVYSKNRRSNPEVINLASHSGSVTSNATPFSKATAEEQKLTEYYKNSSLNKKTGYYLIKDAE